MVERVRHMVEGEQHSVYGTLQGGTTVQNKFNEPLSVDVNLAQDLDFDRRSYRQCLPGIPLDAQCPRQASLVVGHCTSHLNHCRHHLSITEPHMDTSSAGQMQMKCHIRDALCCYQSG